MTTSTTIVRFQNMNNGNVDLIKDNENVIKFKNLKVWTPEEKSWWRRKATKPNTMIINDVSGCIKEGEFVAVLGPSGAGKTTFLVSLAGKCTLSSEGAVTIRGRNVKELKQGVEIVPQVEVFMNTLSVMEHLVFMTEMKLGSCKITYNKAILNTVVKELKLKPHEGTLIGALSGGERRLLSVATSLLSNPQILICDEPTTGLDSYNALLVAGVLKKIAMSGKIVICSVHQPSSDLFMEFSSVMLMAEGMLLFHGSQTECKNLFESLDHHCPKNYNPAEFYIRAVSSNPISYVNYTRRLMELQRKQLHTLDISCVEAMETLPHFRTPRRHWMKQVQLLLWRSSLSMKRELRNNLLQLIICLLMSSIIIGTCYVGISGTTQRGVQDLRGFIWLVCSEICFSLSYSALYVFESEMTLFKREAGGGVYSCSAYLVARFLGMMPRCIVWPIAFVVIATIAVHLPNYVMTAIEFTIALIVTAFAATAYGLGMAALFTSTGVMSDVMPCTDLPLFLMSGTFLRISSLPLWLHPLKYISHFYYGMDAMSNIYWRQINFIDCPSSSSADCVLDGAAVLLQYGYSNNFIVEDILGITFITFGWTLLGYYGLRKEVKKGYAY